MMKMVMAGMTGLLEPTSMRMNVMMRMVMAGMTRIA